MTGRYAILAVSILILGFIPAATAQQMMFAEGTTFDFPAENISIELGQSYEWHHVTPFPSALRVEDAFIWATADGPQPLHIVLQEYNISEARSEEHPIIESEDIVFDIHVDGAPGTTAIFNFTHVPDPDNYYTLHAAGEPGRTYHDGGDITWTYEFGPPTTFTLIHTEDDDDVDAPDEDDPDEPITPPDDPNGTDEDDTDEDDPADPDDPNGTDEDDTDEDDPDDLNGDDPNGVNGIDDPEDPEDDTLLEGTVLYVLIAFIVIGFLVIGGIVGYRMLSGKQNRSQRQQQQQQQQGQQYRQQQQWNQGGQQRRGNEFGGGDPFQDRNRNNR